MIATWNGTPVASRYNRARISAEVELHRKRLGWRMNVLAMVSGMSGTEDNARTTYYHAKRRHSWSIVQVGSIAEALGAPDWWPFREWTVDLRQRYPGNPPPTESALRHIGDRK